ncbi:MAG: DUF423 domain-containing protein [Xanthomonadales bacterium]|nr:DUF423 domain-containing protein [Xanthomonadales bacterium]
MNSISNCAKPWVIIAALLGASAVLAGAFGAHGLKAILTPAQLVTWKMASFYQLVHAVLLMALAASALIELKSFRLASKVLLLGIVLFSGSLYLLLLIGIKFLAILTPIGGVLLVAGWLLLAFAALRNKNI